MSQVTDVIVEYVAALENEHYRMLTHLEHIHNIIGDMLEEERRSGPAAYRPVREVREKLRAVANASTTMEAIKSQGVGMRTMQKGED